MIALAIVIAVAVALFVAKALGSSSPGFYRGKSAEAWHWRYVKAHKAHSRLGVTLRQTRRVANKTFRRDARYAIDLASEVFGVSRSDMYAVAQCESPGLRIHLRNASTASGLFQFLDSTWANQGVDGFAVWDPVANALGAARIVAREGWKQWSCRP
jgi:hypothetical protein